MGLRIWSRSILMVLCLFAPATVQAAGELVLLVTNDDYLVEGLNDAVKDAGMQGRSANREHAAFLGVLSALATGNLDSFRPAWLDPGMTALWEQGASACRIRAGKPPYGMKNKVAFLCGRELGRVLWQLYLDREQPAWVLEGTFLPGKNMEEGSLMVVAYRPGESNRRMLGEDFKGGSAGKAKLSTQTRTLGKRLLAGEGQSKPREVLREMPSAPPGAADPTAVVGDPNLMAGTVLELPALPRPAGCAGPLPGLNVEPADAPLAGSVVKLWSKSTAGQAGEAGLTCKLSMEMLGPTLAGSELKTVVARLECGQRKLAANAYHISLTGTHPVLAKDLVKRLLEWQCGAAR